MSASTFAQLSFQLGNPPGAPNTIYASTKPADNQNLTLRFTTNTATSLAAGQPVPLSSAPTATCSLIYLNLTALGLSENEFNALTVLPATWAGQRFPETRTICLAAKQAVSLDVAPASIDIAIGKFALANPPAGNVTLTATYFHVPGLTTGGLGVPSKFGVLLQAPPDEHDLDLHDVLALSVPQTGVVCSVEGYPSVQNSLNLTFGPGDKTRTVPSGPNTAFVVSFVYADAAPGFGALTTPNIAASDNFQLGPGALVKSTKGSDLILERNVNAESWRIDKGQDQQSPSWKLTPPNGQPIIGSGPETVSFTFTGIKTEFQPGPTLMFVSYSGVPGYQDGAFTVLLTKWPHVTIDHVTVTPNPAHIENPEGVAVVIDWAVADAGALRLTSTDGNVDQDVTGLTRWPTNPPLLIARTTKFELNADGLYGANLDNKAWKSTRAVVTPKIDFSGEMQPDGEFKLNWNVAGAGARQVQIDGIPGPQNPRELSGSITWTPGHDSPLPFSFKLHALDENGAEIGSKTLKRGWKEGPSATVDTATAGMAIAPDGSRLYVFSGWLEGSIVVLDPVTLQSPRKISVDILPAAVACSLHPARIFALSWGTAPALTIIDANSYDVVATLPLAELVSPPPDLHWVSPPGLAADDKYIFIKVFEGPNSLIVLDAQTHQVVCSSGNADISSPTTLALSRTRLSYIGDNDRVMVLELDKQPLQPRATTATGDGTLVTTADDVHQYTVQDEGVTTFDGPDWQNPKPLNPVPNSTFYGMAVTADGMQGLARIGNFFGPYTVQVLEFSPDFEILHAYRDAVEQ